MSDQEFQTQVLTELAKLNGRFDSLEGRFDSLEGKVDSIDGRLGVVESKIDSIDGRLGVVEGKVDSIEGKVDSLEGKVDSLSVDLRDFKENQEQFNNAIWNLNNQSFQSINEIRSEVVAPWKLRKNA